MAFLAGERLTAARLNAELGFTWTEYSPTWTTSGTQPSLGLGKLKGEWARIGGLLRVRISLLWGSTTTGGTNSWSFGLPPVPAFYDTDFAPWPIWNGSASMRDASAFLYYHATCVVDQSGTGLSALYSSAQLSATAPFTWANGDELSLNVNFKPA